MANSNLCISEQDVWATVLNTTMQLRVSSLYANTAYDLKNSSIQSVSAAQKSVSTSFKYRADEVFQVLEFAFSTPVFREDINSTSFVFPIFTAITIS